MLKASSPGARKRRPLCKTGSLAIDANQLMVGAEPQKLLQRRLARLRRKASDEIERLLEFLDASDPYAATEIEIAIDDGPCDTDELEADHDHGEADYEPSLGSVDGPERGGQVRWAQGAVDREEACEDEGIAI
jgi:hypothetical protein